MSNPEQASRLRECLRLLVRKLGMLERGEASCCSLTLAQCHTLTEVGRAGSIALSDLAETLGLDKSTVSRSVDNLAGEGLISRTPDPHDRRAVTLSLSKQGEAMYSDIETRMTAYFTIVINNLPAEEREQVVRSLELLVRSIVSGDCC